MSPRAIRPIICLLAVSIATPLMVAGKTDRLVEDLDRRTTELGAGTDL